MKKVFGLYIHIPYCEKKCHYCNFLTFVNRDGTIEEYMTYLNREIKMYKDKNYALDTIYFGGGTPSYLDEYLIVETLETIADVFDILPHCEISFEMNPESVTKEKIRAYLQAGINRFSMGVQSFDDRVLKMMGRLHDEATVLERIDLMEKMGVDNLSIDMMFANPKQDFSILTADVKKAAALPINHISYYSLMIKPGTPFERWVQTGQFQLYDEDIEREMYYKIKEELVAKGFEQYEISSFSRDQMESQHNLKYWRLQNYIGVGLGASGNIDLERYDNLRNFPAYFAAIDKNEWPRQEVFGLSMEDREHEFIMLNMRLLRGFAITEFNQRFHTDFLKKYAKAIAKHQRLGTIEVTPERVKFTPYGLDVGNQFYLDII